MKITVSCVHVSLGVIVHALNVRNRKNQTFVGDLSFFSRKVAMEVVSKGTYGRIEELYTFARRVQSGVLNRSALAYIICGFSRHVFQAKV